MNLVVIQWFESPLFLFYGLLIGIVLGFFLQKGRLSSYDVIVGQFLFRDFTMLKIMLSAILVAGVLIYGALSFGFITALPIEPVLLKSALVGGGLFGIGMALLGYCPASCCAAIGQGSRDAWFGVLGMVTGTVLFESLYSRIMAWYQGVPAGHTVSTFLEVSPWAVFALLAMFLLFLARWTK